MISLNEISKAVSERTVRNCLRELHTRIVASLSLSLEFEVAIAHSIRTQLMNYRLRQRRGEFQARPPTSALRAFPTSQLDTVSKPLPITTTKSIPFVEASFSPIPLEKNSSKVHPLPTKEGHQPSLGWVLAAGIGFLCVILIALAAVLTSVYRSYFVRRFQPLPSGFEGDDAL